MHWRTIIRLFGILLLFYSLSFLPSILIACWFQDGKWPVFAVSMLAAAGLGAVFWLSNLHQRSELTGRDGFVVVALFWAVLGGVGALPFLLGLELNLTDAVFESISGFTTTGATVIVGLDQLPPSILYHRQQIQWLGGMGIIVLAVAILPILGVGGMQLYRAEASGVTKHEKLTPRIMETARALWIIYVILTVACASAYLAAGMDWFDAIGHAFTTIATGGFSTHDASIGYFNSAAIESIAVFFMLAGGINFAVHFIAWRRLELTRYAADPEFKAYAVIFLGATILVAGTLFWFGVYGDHWHSLRYAAFQVASIFTSTGYGTATFAEWPSYLPLFLVIVSFTGGCAGSTAGGIKVVRVVLLAKLGLQQLFHLAHPRAISVVKLGQRPVPGNVVLSVLGFYVLYVGTALLLTVANMAAGLDLESALGVTVATINLLGPGLGDVAVTFATVDSTVKWLGVVGMLAGRLEIFTLLILLLPAFWKA